MLNVNSNYSSSNPSFGMALRMDESTIAKKIGHYAADEAKKARPALEKLAEDVDVFVKPYVGDEVGLNRLKVCVQDITPPTVKSKNPIVNFFREIKRQKQIAFKPSANGAVFVSFDNLEGHLVNEVKDQKKTFLRSK